MSKNYYMILSIPKNASQDDIRVAYRRLAKEFHPDRYGKDQAPFQVIQEAYSILSNPKSRESYDHSLLPKSSVSNPIRHTYKERSADINIEPLIPEGDTNFRNLNSSDPLFQRYSRYRFVCRRCSGTYILKGDPAVIRVQFSTKGKTEPF